MGRRQSEGMLVVEDWTCNRSVPTKVYVRGDACCVYVRRQSEGMLVVEDWTT
jgi:hypothetical protein